MSVLRPAIVPPAVLRPALFHSSLLTIAIALVLAGCQATNRDVTTSPVTGAPTQHVIVGRATYFEKIMLPPGSHLRVQLIDNQLTHTPRAVLAEQVVEGVTGPPIAFTLPFDPAKLRTNGQYGLHASLYGPDDKLWFITDTRVAVTPGDAKPVEFRMIHVTDPQPGTMSTLISTHWQCGNLRVGAAYDTEQELARLWFSGRSLQLPIARSGSGARYADSQGNEFWTKGDSSTLKLAGQSQVDCTRTQQASPWNEATARGVGFRAVGNEPGWFVEVDQGEAPALRATLDYGERKIDVARMQGLSGLLGWVGKTVDGIEVKLLVERKTCQDGMSGETFEASAQLTVAGKRYDGCGAYLFD